MVMQNYFTEKRNTNENRHRSSSNSNNGIGSMDNTKTKEIRLTASQQPVFNDVKENYECMMDVLDNHPGGWLLTPEGSLSGYCENAVHKKDPTTYFKYLDKIEQRLTKEKLNLALSTGHIESDGLPYNQIRYYREGTLIGTYSKQLMTHNDNFAGEFVFYVAGTSTEHVALSDDIKAGSLICNDAWAYPPVSPKGNPYLWREYGKQRCHVVFVSVNCGTQEFDQLVYEWHVNHLRLMARTFEYHVVVSSSCTDMNGEVINHMQCPSGIVGPDGNWIKQCSQPGMDMVSHVLNI